MQENILPYLVLIWWTRQSKGQLLAWNVDITVNTIHRNVELTFFINVKEHLHYSVRDWRLGCGGFLPFVIFEGNLKYISREVPKLVKHGKLRA